MSVSSGTIGGAPGRRPASSCCRGVHGHREHALVDAVRAARVHKPPHMLAHHFSNLCLLITSRILRPREPALALLVEVREYL